MKGIKPGWLRLAAMLQQMPADAASKMIAQIADTDPPLAQWLATQRVSLSQLLQLTPAELAQVMAGCDERGLLLVLKGLDASGRDLFLRAVSRRRAEGLRDSLMQMPKVAVKEVEAAQQALLNHALELADKGAIQLYPEPML